MDIKNIDIKDVISNTIPEQVDINSNVTQEKHKNLRKILFKICVAAPIISMLFTAIVGILSR